MSPVTFEMGLAKVEVEESVVLKLRQFELIGCQVQRSFENAEGFLLVEKPHCQEVADLQDETLSLLQQCGLGLGNFPVEQDNVLLRREICQELAESLRWLLGEIGERVTESPGVSKTLEQNHVVD